MKKGHYSTFVTFRPDLLSALISVGAIDVLFRLMFFYVKRRISPRRISIHQKFRLCSIAGKRPEHMASSSGVDVVLSWFSDHLVERFKARYGRWQ